MRDQDDGRVILSAACRDGALEIAIEDNGDGVPGTIRDRIFDPFFTTKPPEQGAGLGLSVAARNLAGIGAELHLDTAYSPGARFLIRLPLRSEPQALPAQD